MTEELRQDIFKLILFAREHERKAKDLRHSASNIYLNNPDICTKCGTTLSFEEWFRGFSFKEGECGPCCVKAIEDEIASK